MFSHLPKDETPIKMPTLPFASRMLADDEEGLAFEEADGGGHNEWLDRSPRRPPTSMDGHEATLSPTSCVRDLRHGAEASRELPEKVSLLEFSAGKAQPGLPVEA
jgi:hypothetical protein